MRAYTDIFKQPIGKDEVRLAVAVVVRSGQASPSLLQRQMKVGYGKAATLLKLLGDAGIVTSPTGKPRVVVLRNEAQALNAALRQLKKGRKA